MRNTMTTYRSTFIILTGALVLLSCGCQHRCLRPHIGCQQAVPAPVPVRGVAPVPFPGPNAMPQPASPFPPAAPPISGQFPPQAPPGVNNYQPPAGQLYQSQWKPDDAQVRLGSPVPSISARPPQARIPAQPPTPNEFPPPEVTPQPYSPPAVETPKTPAGGDNDPLKSPFPVGIPQFAIAKKGVAAGLRPLLGGLDWLQRNQYQTVVHLVSPGEDDSADRTQVEKRGMKFVRLEVSPLGLSQQSVKEFTDVVTNTQGHPLFVYDREGALAGSMWYLHFRTSEFMSDEVARAQAGALGLRENGDGLHNEMWRAAQNYMDRHGS